MSISENELHTYMGIDSQKVNQPSAQRFEDGAHYRIEIPSVENPVVLNAVLEEADRLGVTVNRVSQGSGAMLLTGSELDEMAAMGGEAGLEVCLFVGPRSGWDIGSLAQSYSANIVGSRQAGHAIEDVLRAVEHGIRGFLVADIGLLAVFRDLQRDGVLPPDITWKVSAYFGVFNSRVVRMLEEMGATTINVAADLSPVDLSELRSATDVPLDLYIEAPDGMGGSIRIPEAGQLVSLAAPLHIKFGLRNATSVYPAGLHVEASAALMAREKVHRAAIALEWIDRTHPDLIQSVPGADGLAVPIQKSAS